MKDKNITLTKVLAMSSQARKEELPSCLSRGATCTRKM
eukprot:CAMPEP_0178388794 /NCGR_PEP_ID=MMETSP0689_2-20121128/9777_1 /TAXON_ID=160604 /ORGANISM="Amphidinium massartii, Strain CS-259" /LENGTH=37 /DNA_ID= /DNA_START= /DNA_END= /DNA_ORIENTATION=